MTEHNYQMMLKYIPHSEIAEFLADDEGVRGDVLGVLEVELKGRWPHGTERVLYDLSDERIRQIEEKGWTPDHDDDHVLGELAALAAFYAVPDGVRDWDLSSTGYGDTLAEALLPDGWAAKAGEDRRRDLVKAGALILAEIERLDREARDR